MNIVIDYFACCIGGVGRRMWSDVLFVDVAIRHDRQIFLTDSGVIYRFETRQKMLGIILDYLTESQSSKLANERAKTKFLRLHLISELAIITESYLVSPGTSCSQNKQKSISKVCCLF